MTRDAARREVSLTLAGAARLVSAACIGAWVESFVDPFPGVRWGLFGGAVLLIGAVIFVDTANANREQ